MQTTVITLLTLTVIICIIIVSSGKKQTPGCCTDCGRCNMRCGSRKPITLNDAAVGNRLTVIGLTAEGAVKRRIMDMGITKGTQVCVRRTAPFGDPIEITVRGYELSIRRADAKMIQVG